MDKKPATAEKKCSNARSKVSIRKSTNHYFSSFLYYLFLLVNPIFSSIWQYPLNYSLFASLKESYSFFFILFFRNDTVHVISPKRKNPIPRNKSPNLMLAMIPAIKGTAAEISEGLLSIVSKRIFSTTSNIPAKRGANVI